MFFSLDGYLTYQFHCSAYKLNFFQYAMDSVIVPPPATNDFFFFGHSFFNLTYEFLCTCLKKKKKIHTFVGKI